MLSEQKTYNNTTYRIASEVLSNTTFRKVIKESNYLLKEFKNLSNLASQADDKTTEAFADDHVAKLEKDLWMMTNMIS